MFNERYLSISSIIIMIFVITIGFNNCGEGFQTIGDGTDGLFSLVDPTNPEPQPVRPPLVQEGLKYLSISPQAQTLRFNDKKSQIKRLKNGIHVIPDFTTQERPKLYYGSVDEIFSNTSKLAPIPNLNDFSSLYELVRYSFSYDQDMLFIKILYKNSDNNNFRWSAYRYLNNNGNLEPEHYYSSSDNPKDAVYFEKKIPVSTNWDYFSDENYIRNSITNEEIPVLENVKISDDESWLISKRDDNNCYVTNLKTKQFTYIGSPRENFKPSCWNYSFLNNNIIAKNYTGNTYIDYITETKGDITIIDFQNSSSITVPSDFFAYDKKTTVLTFLGQDNQLKKQYLDEFLAGATPSVSYPTGTIESFGKSFSMAYPVNNQFMQYITSMRNQKTILVNSITNDIIDMQKLFPRQETEIGVNPSKTFHSFIKYDDQYYLTFDYKSFFKVTFSDQPQQQPQLDEFDCPIEANPKEKLSETCLWTLVNNPKRYKNFFKFEVRFPLTTETLDSKNRWVYLPPGTSIDNSDDDNWIYPKGTIFYKNFAYKDYSSDPTTYINIETRILEKTGDGIGADAWRPSVYLWNAEQTDAEYKPEGADVPLNHKNQQYTYKVPNLAACTQCHRGNNDMTAGFNHLQLESGFGKLSTLKAHHSNNLLTKAPTEYEDIPSNLDSHKYTDSTRDTVGYLSTNCSGCHSPKGIASFTGLFFNFKLGTTDPKLTSAYVTGVEKGKLIPGDHANSRIYTAVQTGYMPKGTVTPATQLSNMIKIWIDSFEATD